MRAFHRVLAKRLAGSWPLSERQKAFLLGDSLADNIWLLRSVIDYHKERFKGLNVTFVDVSKAFDSVSHQSIVLAAGRMGTPGLLLRYLSNLCRDNTVRLKWAGSMSGRLPVGRGVRQGDPLSPILFNGVMDWVLSALDPGMGVAAGGAKANHLAFADDVVLLTHTRLGMSAIFRQLSQSLENVGLTMNARKCASFTIVGVGKRSMTCYCDSTSYLVDRGVEVRGMSVDGF